MELEVVMVSGFVYVKPPSIQLIIKPRSLAYYMAKPNLAPAPAMTSSAHLDTAKPSSLNKPAAMQRFIRF